jgi:tyrosine-specific transport protein
MNKTFGAILLICGCAIGLGMLGLPVVTGAAGFLPSAVLLIASWAFMLATALTLARVTLTFDVPEVNLITMGKELLGSAGKWMIIALFAFLFYALMVGYSIAGARLLSDFSMLIFGYEPPFEAIVSAIGAGLFFILFRGVQMVDWVNRFCVAGLGGCYILLLTMGLPHVKLERLSHMAPLSLGAALPIAVLSFGYHNLIPTIVCYLGRNRRAITKAICIGSMIPLVIYIAWEFVILGVLPLEGVAAWKKAEGKGELVTSVLAASSSPALVTLFARGFGFFAVATPFLSVALSFFDFLRDGLQVGRSHKNTILLSCAVLLPPLILASLCPALFLIALSYAGGFALVILFGIVPVLMAQRKKIISKPLAYTLIIASCAIICITALSEMGLL